MFIGNYWHLLTIPEHCRWQREKYKWIKHKSFKDSFILLLLWVGTECKFPSSRKTSCPNTQEILLLALHKAVKEEAKLAASDELKASQEVQDSKGFHMLQTWDSGETACPALCRESRKQASTQKITVTVINSASGTSEDPILISLKHFCLMLRHCKNPHWLPCSAKTKWR